MPSAEEMSISRQQLESLFSGERLSTYLAHCGGDFDSAVRLYRWNAAVTAAFWEPIGHLEVALRNTLAAQLSKRHLQLGQAGSWLDDPNRELSERARDDIGAARELSFGFWRFLITKKLTGLWPDLAGGFPDAPDRQRQTVEKPIARLHDFRNRLAHHQPVWNRQPQARYDDLLMVAGYIDPALPGWIEPTSTVQFVLGNAP
jgi:hypothetical protein